MREQLWEPDSGTPWNAGAPPLNRSRHRYRGSPIGWVPSRLQILAGYCDPDDGTPVEGQVRRAIRQLGADATFEQIARHLALSLADRELLEVLFATLDAKAVE